MTAGWATPADIVARLRRRWDRGEFLTAWARGHDFEPVAVPIRGPSTAELSVRFDEAREWIGSWRAIEGPGLRVRTRPAGHRTIGANDLPDRLEIDDYDPLWRLLAVTAAVRRFAQLRAATADELPQLVGWMNSHPMIALAHADDWPRLVSTVRWTATSPVDRHMYLREVPVPGVDTKFIEKRRGILADLLDAVLPDERIDRRFAPSQFERRYGFALRPTMIRIRTLDRSRPLLPGVTELSVRAGEFAEVAPDVMTVFIVENEISYLAFPCVVDAAVIFGSGFAVSGFGSLPWFSGRRVVYWGDIDTHGFVALDRVRAFVPDAESMLMDHETLFAHADQWVVEPSPANAHLPRLTAPEQTLYRELVDGVHGDRIRLEQERVSYPYLRTVVG